MHADDLAAACLLLMELYDDPAPINVGTGTDITIRELAHLVAELIGFKGSVNFDQSKPDGTPRKVLDVLRINALGWSPRISLRAGMEQTYAWYQANLPSAGISVVDGAAGPRRERLRA